jgi:hypothetical protein
MKKVAVALFGILAVSPVQADEVSLVGHGFSHHIDNHNFNERNYGGAVRYGRDDWAIQVGAYRNSINKDSVYAGIDWSPLKYETHSCLKFEAGAYYGFATGYKFDITPVVGLQAAVKCGDVFARVRAMPDPYYNSKAVGAIEVGLVLKRF